MSAEELGERLLAEVQEAGLDEILNDLRLRDDAGSRSTFGLSPLDNILQAIIEARASSGKPQPTSPIIELMTLCPDTGASHLLYHLTALSVLPTNHGGRQSCVLIIDTDNTISVPHLTHQLKTLAFNNRHRNPNTTTASLNKSIHHSLKHIHTFHPQSLPSTIATITSLTSYLFNPTLHSSFDRPIAFIALLSASTFSFQARSDAEDSAFLAHTSTSRMSRPSSTQGYTHLAAALKNASRDLHTPVLYTTRCSGPGKNSTTGFDQGPRSFRPSLPPPWGAMPVLRVVVTRAGVKKLPVGITVEEARREDEVRRGVVERGKFEVFVNEWGLEEGVVWKLIEKGVDGFEFFVRREEGFRMMEVEE